MLRAALRQEETLERFAHIYACGKEEASRYTARVEKAIDRFEEWFGKGRDLYVFSAPGRTEVGGNHTDHQHGRVLAAGVNLDAIAVAAKRDDRTACVHSEGYDPDIVEVDDPVLKEGELGHSAALLRGMCARFAELGCKLSGFDAYTTSNVLSGSGLSSSAAFEVLLGTMLNGMFFDDTLTALQIAQIGQYAENKFFGKPCGLMDQAASSIGSFITIDFRDTESPRCGRSTLILRNPAMRCASPTRTAAIPTSRPITRRCRPRCAPWRLSSARTCCARWTRMSSLPACRSCAAR